MGKIVNLEPRMPFIIGENVGPYRVIEQLGQGGMATVFKAYHAALDRYVAIKVLHPAFMEDPNFLARFQREARVVAKLDHPNIVPIFDFADHHGQPYLVMKFIEGETLKARLARGPLSKQEGLKIVESVGAALGYAHKRGILHRDIKPSNVLLSPDGNIYLADFGLARIAEAGESTLSSDMMLGTPHYISPEQARGERNLDEGTDIYSFGVVLYELVVGRVPFSSDTPFSIIHDHIYTPLPLPRAVNPRVPEAVQRVLLKALAKDRADRFATVEEMVISFKSGISEVPTDKIPDFATVPLPPKTRPVAMREETVAAVEVEPTPAEAPALVTASPAAPAAVRKPGRTWIWAAGGLALTCLCVLGFVLVIGQQGGGQGGQETPMVSPVAVETESPTVRQARAAVEADPANPQAHLDLAGALSDADFPQLAEEQFVIAGDLYHQMQNYPEAAQAYSKALDLQGGPGADPPPWIDPLMESLFLGAEAQTTWVLVNDLQLRYADWSALRPVAARSLVQQGQVARAMELVNATLAGKPDDPVALAVLAEINLLDNRTDQAMENTERALRQPNLPDWLRLYLEEFLRRGTEPRTRGTP
jgi:tRNA A-37 threonylcarbamoyl transferase component Bud32